MTQTAFTICAIATVRTLLSQQEAEKLVCAFVSSRLDYCNALYTGLPKATVEKQQTIQNAAVRVLIKTKMRDHVTPVLCIGTGSLCLLQLIFKVELLVLNALNGLLSFYNPPPTQRSSTAALLAIPKVTTKTCGDVAFSHFAPEELWNVCL